MEIKRQEPELAERKALQGLEAQLAEAELIEQQRVSFDDQCLSSDDENEGQNVTELPECDNYSPMRRQTERREAEQREVEQHEMERREARWREARWREARRREAEWHETEQRKTEQRNVEQRESGRRETDRLKQGYNQVEPFITRQRDEQSRKNALPAEQQFQTHYVPPVNTFSPQQALPTPSYLQEPLIPMQEYQNNQFQDEECMLVSKVCRVLCQERIVM